MSEVKEPVFVTWGGLAAAEPRLTALREEAREIQRGAPRRGSFCRVKTMDSQFNKRLLALVGPGREEDGPRFLFTLSAFVCAHDCIEATLPRCFDCHCGADSR
jgi:hypothetical protein